jgi:ABC-type amino acid transport substrate-binding protein
VSKLIVLLVIAAGLGLWPCIIPANELRGGFPDDKSVGLDHGQFRGSHFVAEKLACVVQITGFDIRWKSFPTNRLLSMAAKLQLDFIYPMGFSDQRDKFLSKSEYVFLSEDQFVYKRPKPDFSDTARVHIGARLGSPQMSVLIDRGFRNIEVGNSYDALLKMLNAGRVDAVVMPDKVLEMFAAPVIKTFETEDFYQRQIGFYVGKDWPPDQLVALNAAIVRCRD